MPEPEQQAQQLTPAEWDAKKGKYTHENGCGAGPDEPCTCEFPYPRRKLSPKDRIVREWGIEVIGRWRLWRAEWRCWRDARQQQRRGLM